MLAARDSSGAPQSISAIKVRDAGGTLRTIQKVMVRDSGGVVRTVFSALGASASPSVVTGIGDSLSAISITTQSATAAPAGGSGPYGYAWTQTGGDTATIITPSGATTAFRFAGVIAGDTKNGTFQCVITDATGATASASVTATATNANTA